MKFFLYLLMGVLALSLVGLFVLKKPNGEPWISVSDFTNTSKLTNQIDAIKTQAVSKAQSLLQSEPSNPTIYKWQDDKGVWHYSDKKAENNTSAEWDVPENMTVIPAIKPLPKKSNSKSDEPDKTKRTLPQGSNKISTLINDANNVQAIMDNRTKKIDEQL